MQEGSGDAGRQMKEAGYKIALAAEQSVVARAARNGEPTLVSDVFQEPDWLPNPLLPDTKSEIAVPIKLGDELLGVLDAQSDTVGGLTEEDQLVLIGLCGQIAVAIDDRRTTEALRESEERFRHVITSISHHIYMSEITEDGSYINHYISSNVEDLTGYPLEKFLNNWDFWPSVVIHPDDREIAAAQAEQLGQGRHSITEYRMVKADGQVIWVRDNARVQVEGTSNIIYGVVSDITERRRVREALQKSEERNRLLLESSPDPIVIYDEKGQVIYVNPAFTQIFGWSEEELLGKRIDFVPEENKPETRTALERLFKEGTVLGFETRRFTKDGHILDVQLSGSIFKDKDGNVAGSTIFTRDITARKQTEIEREQLLARTETLYQAGARLNAAQTYDDIVTVLRKFTLLGRQTQTVTLGYFDHPWTSDNKPEGANILARWSQHPSDAFSSRYLIADFPSSDQILRPDEPVLIEDIATDARMDEETRLVYLERFKAKSALFAPLLAAGQWIGYINATYGRLTTFPEADIRRLMALAGQAAVAVQNLRNIALAEQRAAHLEMLTQIEAALSQATNEEEILTALARNLAPNQPDRLVLQYLDTDENDQPAFTNTVAVWDDGAIRPDDPDLYRRRKIDPLSASKLWLESPNEVLFVSDLETDLRSDENVRTYLSQLQIAAFATLPLRSGNRWQGLVSFDWTEPHIYSPGERFVFQQLLESVGAVVASRRAYLAQEVALSETEILYQAGAELNAVQSYDDIVKVLRRHTLFGQEAQNVSVNHFDVAWTQAQAPEWVYVLARWTKLSPEAVSSRYPLAAFASAATLLRPDSPTIIEDIAGDPDLDENVRTLYAQRFGAKSTIFVPLVVGGQWIGYINAIYQQPTAFPEPEVRRLVALAGQAAVAVQSIQRLGDTERRARREQAIREITEKMRAATSLEDLVKTAAEELGKQLSAGHAVIELGIDEG